MIPEIAQADSSGSASQLGEDEELTQKAVKNLTKTHHYIRQSTDLWGYQ